MIDQIYTFFSIEMIYLWLNFGVLPFWFMLLFFPQTKICRIFVTSVFPILVLTAINLYLIFEISKNGFNFFGGFIDRAHACMMHHAPQSAILCN